MLKNLGPTARLFIPTPTWGLKGAKPPSRIPTLYAGGPGNPDQQSAVGRPAVLSGAATLQRVGIRSAQPRAVGAK